MPPVQTESSMLVDVPDPSQEIRQAQARFALDVVVIVGLLFAARTCALDAVRIRDAHVNTVSNFYGLLACVVAIVFVMIHAWTTASAAGVAP